MGCRPLLVLGQEVLLRKTKSNCAHFQEPLHCGRVLRSATAGQNWIAGRSTFCWKADHGPQALDLPSCAWTTTGFIGSAAVCASVPPAWLHCGFCPDPGVAFPPSCGKFDDFLMGIGTFDVTMDRTLVDGLVSITTGSCLPYAWHSGLVFSFGPWWPLASAALSCVMLSLAPCWL